MTWAALRSVGSRVAGFLAGLWRRRRAIGHIGLSDVSDVSDVSDGTKTPLYPACPPWTLALSAPRAPRPAPALPPVVIYLSDETQEERPRARPGTSRAPRKHLARLKAEVLDQLDLYLVYIQRLRKYDPGTYALYRRIGAYICHVDHEAELWKLHPALVNNLPAFGAIAIGLSDRDSDPDFVRIKFAYFTRLQRPGYDIERTNMGVTYRCHLYFDDAEDKLLKPHGHGQGTEIVVNVAPDGVIRPLRVMKSHHQVIRHRKGGSSVVTHQRWGLPELNDQKVDKEGNLLDARNSTVAQRIAAAFAVTINFWLTSARHSMIRVTATKSGIVMPFVVDATDTPAFFADREPVISEDGKKRRIFHVVRAHQRRGKGIRLHFAGVREFQWKGYQINITVPGRDHIDLADATFGALEDVPEAEMIDMLDQAAVGEIVADIIGAPGKLVDA